jgi:hypothetical protein
MPAPHLQEQPPAQLLLAGHHPSYQREAQRDAAGSRWTLLPKMSCGRVAISFLRSGNELRRCASRPSAYNHTTNSLEGRWQGAFRVRNLYPALGFRDDHRACFAHQTQRRGKRISIVLLAVRPVADVAFQPRQGRRCRMMPCHIPRAEQPRMRRCLFSDGPRVTGWTTNQYRLRAISSRIMKVRLF